MKVLVLNGSPSGENSTTLYTVKYIEKMFPESTFEVLNVGQQIKSMEKDQISDRVLEDSNGCYIFKMVDNNSTERYDSECENAITEKENEEFQNKIDELEVDKYLMGYSNML